MLTRRKLLTLGVATSAWSACFEAGAAQCPRKIQIEDLNLQLYSNHAETRLSRDDDFEVLIRSSWKPYKTDLTFHRIIFKFIVDQHPNPNRRYSLEDQIVEFVFYFGNGVDVKSYRSQALYGRNFLGDGYSIRMGKTGDENSEFFSYFFGGIRRHGSFRLRTSVFGFDLDSGVMPARGFERWKALLDKTRRPSAPFDECRR